MIGQKQLLSKVDNLIQSGFPRFTVVTGKKGQGKTELIIEISRKLRIPFCNIGIRIDDIRSMIELAYKLTEPMIYVISNADKMSVGAKNSLLKIIEEPPQQAYFIMELNQLENTLETIKSRCQELKMEQYTDVEIEEMINVVDNGLSEEEIFILKSIATNYYEIKTLVDYNVKEFYDYVTKVYENIYKVQSANSFKLTEKLDLKGDGIGYDLDIFLSGYVYKAMRDMFSFALDKNAEMVTILDKCITTTYIYKTKLNINGINKQSLLDMWILDIRKLWLECN